MANYSTYTNQNGTLVAIDTRVRKQLGIQPKQLQDVAPTHMQHANSVVELATGKRTILANDVAAIAAHVAAL